MSTPTSPPGSPKSGKYTPPPEPSSDELKSSIQLLQQEYLTLVEKLRKSSLTGGGGSSSIPVPSIFYRHLCPNASHNITWLKDFSWRSWTLKRILVASEYKLERARAMLTKAVNWRFAYGTDHLPFLPPPNIFLQGYSSGDLKLASYDRQYRDKNGLFEKLLNDIRVYYVAGWHKWDKQGHPIYIERGGYSNPRRIQKTAKQHHYNPEASEKELMDLLLASHTLVMELGEHLCKVQSVKHKKPIYQFTYICDLAEYGWKHMYAPCFDLLRRAIEIDKNYYPESMHVTFVVNAPAVMSLIWQIIRPCLTQRTRSKVHIMRRGPEQTAKLLEFVDAEHLPDFLGGNCKCRGGCVPVLAK